MNFLYNRLNNSKNGDTIAQIAYAGLFRKGKLSSKKDLLNPRLSNDFVFLYLLLAALKWLFSSGPGLRRVFWAVAIGLGTGLFLGSSGLFLCSNVFGLWMWYTIAAASAFGSIIADREITAEASLKEALED